MKRATLVRAGVMVFCLPEDENFWFIGSAAPRLN